jgi:hypothetical protein
MGPETGYHPNYGSSDPDTSIFYDVIVSMDRKHILLTGGRAPATLELARQCAAHGHRVIVAESMPVHLCRYSRAVVRHYAVPPPNTSGKAFINALIAIIKHEHIDLLIPTCEEIFFIAQGLEQLQEHCDVFCAPIEQLKRLHSKWEFIQRAREYGLAVPETFLLASPADLENFIDGYKKPFVLKPVFSRFATHVHLLDNAQQAHAILSKLPISTTIPWVAQQHLEGQAYCTYSIAHHGTLAAHSTYAVDFTAGRGACINFTACEQAAIERWVTQFVQQEHFSGQIAFDFIVSREGEALPLECNPRATSGLHLFSAEDHIPDVFLNPSPTQSVRKPVPGTQRMLALAMLLYASTNICSWSRLWDWCRTMVQARDVIFAWNDVGPLLAQPQIVWYNLSESRKRHLSALAFSTWDIEWNG